MTTNNFLTRHVKQVAELVRHLTPEEMRELLRLVPKLQIEAFAVSSPDDDVLWAREQLAQYNAEARPMAADDLFLDDRTVAEYFALPEAEREQIWTDLYATAIESAPEREVKPDATLPTG